MLQELLQELLDKAVDKVFGQYDETGMIKTNTAWDSSLRAVR